MAGTVAGNVRLGAPDATDDDVAAAMTKAACASIDPRRRIAQNGADLSAGERQRIALARCFLRTQRGADVLLLDEPTAHLDAPTEQRMLAAIRQLSAGRFVLMVAHRPSAIQFADRIIEVGAATPKGCHPCAARRCHEVAVRGHQPHRFDEAAAVLGRPGTGTVLHGMWPGCARDRQRRRSHRLRCVAHQRCGIEPPIVTLTVAIVGVRVFALGKAALRYLERLVSHDVAFRMLATIRMRFVAALEPLSPGALPAYHRGDLLARMVSDVDGLQDLPLRVLQPVAVAAGAAALAVGIVATLLPSSAAALAVTLAVAAVAAPAATSWANRCAEARLATARAELSTSVVTLLNARADLVAYGAAWQHLAQLRALDAGLTRIARSSALAAGVGAGLAVVCAGGAVWGALALGTRRYVPAPWTA